jgi:hypothetical protein
MKSTRNKKFPANSGKQTRSLREATRLVELARNSISAGSRDEMLFWENEVLQLAGSLIDAGNDAAIDAAIQMTLAERSDAYDVVASLCEAATETVGLHDDKGQPFNVMLLAVPLVVWSRYAVPSGKINQHRDALEALMTQLHAHVLASDVRTTTIPVLHSIDQMPMYFAMLHKLAISLGQAAIGGERFAATPAKLPSAADLFADSRILLVGIAAPAGKPFFRWQERDATTTDGFVSRERCRDEWIKQSRPHFARLLPACEFEALLPEAFFSANREADRRVRPYALRTDVAFITDSLKIAPNDVRAVVAAVGAPDLVEYRVSFIPRGQAEVVHGTIWPVYRAEADDDEAEIVRILRECHVNDIIRPQGLFEPEECDDCGAPLFSDVDGEMVHPDWPEDSEQSRAHYH